MRHTRLAPVLLLLAFPLFAEPSATVTAFLESWAAGDARAAERYWTDPSSPGFHRYVRRVLATSCITVHDIRILGVRPLAEDRSEAEVELRLTRRNVMPGAPERHEVSVALLGVRRTGTEWRIESWLPREERDVDELLALTSPAARSEWLDRRGESWTPALVRALEKRSVMLMNQSQLQWSRELIAYAARVATALGDTGGLSLARGAESALERKELTPAWKRSLVLAEESAALAEGSGDPDAIVSAQVRLGRAIFHISGIPTEAARFRRALDLADFVEDEALLAIAASQMAIVDDWKLDVRGTLIHAGLAERYARSAGSAAGMLSAELNFAGLYDRISDPELAALHYDRAAAIARANGFDRLYASFFFLLAKTHFQIGRPAAELLPLVEEVLAIPDVRATAHVAADLYTTRAGAHVALGNYEQAEADLAEAIAHASDRDAVFPYATLSELRMLQGRYADAKNAAELSWMSLVASEPYVEALRRLGEADAALNAILCAVEQTHSLENLVPEARHRQTFLMHRSEPERWLVELLVERGEHMEAFRAAEAAKARLLLDVATRTAWSGDGAAPRDPRERLLAEKVDRINRATLVETDAARLESLREELARLRLDLDDVRTQNAARTRAEGPEGGPASSRVEWPYAGAAALEYVVGRRQTIIFVVRSGAAGTPRLDVRVVDVERPKLIALILQLRERIATRDPRYTEPAQRLYELLIAPVEPLIASAKTLCIIPDGDLWKVPFHTLRDSSGSMLVDRAAVFYAPSVRALHAARGKAERPSAPRLLALGNPSIGATTAARFRAFERGVLLGDLAEAEREVGRIARLYGSERSTVAVGAEAREALFKAQAPRFDVLHLATHGLVDDRAPMFSALLLAAAKDDAEDGLLEAREVVELDLDADLVVLSACDTAAGKIGGGEGILGLSWAFLAAGARGLVGSQWKAPSAATEALMVDFHRRLLSGDSPAEALRHAQLRIMRDERYVAPLDWAPFIVVGDGL
ncbi:MAG TPA: CHAT domain-containing protein [Thermoanaerobaculia bacterium]|nr:CHAT domain-containing protein [Thermoanaerobaculia bacterium]